MAGISYERQVQKLVEQIETLQSIDTEKYKYFSVKATDALSGIKNGDYTSILDLEAEIIDFLADRVMINQRDNLPVPIPKQKTSLMNRLFKRRDKESEISKIADQVSPVYIETSNGQFVPDRRTAVYDFFKNSIKEPRNGEVQTIHYTNSEGYERTFKMVKDELALVRIKIGESKIGFYEYGAFDEILYLARYDRFINSNTGDKNFINELGKEIEKASMGYDPKDSIEYFIAGERLIKSLNRNPVYRQTRKSFNRAYDEYIKTFNDFRMNEADREKSYRKKSSVAKGISVKAEESNTYAKESTPKEYTVVQEENGQKRNSFVEELRREVEVEEPSTYAKESTPKEYAMVREEDKPTRPTVDLSKKDYTEGKRPGVHLSKEYYANRKPKDEGAREEN